ncbi:Anucleate primary sterigmata protein B [Lentinula edodes]|uniref:Anucleate primary sterigmata protein B n=1 Tax=Lentinula edodes TaxID=5353 RepID=A0A1Q3E3C2_LENED|nr:Anucleate primary sterigmata protein B [Lentinula edodes]
MSDALLNAFTDSSMQSLSNFELTLGSLPSDFSTPPRPGLRVPSATSQTTAQSSAAVTTPPPATLSFRRKGESSLSRKLTAENEVEGNLETPSAEKSRWGDAGLDTPSSAHPPASRHRSRPSISGSQKGVPLTLRDQEKHIDSLKKENFDIKLRVHFLEERLAELAPEQMDAALKQNITLKIETHNRGREIKRLKKLLLELERELERLQRSTGNRGARERELEAKLEERDREIRELRRRRASIDGGDAALREVEGRNTELEEELENVRGLLEDNVMEIERLQDLVERKGNTSSAGDAHRIDELESDLDQLKQTITEQAQLLDQKEDDKVDLLDEIEALRLNIENLQQRREVESIERSESRAQMLEEREEREAVEDDLNALKDRLAAALIELQQKEDDIERKDQMLEDMTSQHQQIVGEVEEEWRGEVAEHKQQVEELRDVLAERDAECKELRITVTELEATMNDLHGKFEATLAHLEQEADDKDAQIESLNEAIEKLSEQVYILEDENDKFKEDHDKMKEEDDAERERLETLAAALKEKLTKLKAELDEMTEMYETCRQDIHAHRSRQEELATHVETLVDELEREREARERAESDLDAADKEHDAKLRAERRALEAKESALQSTLDDLARTQSLLTQREADLQAVQTALQTLETESKRAGETHSTAQFSLQLEVDRLKRDLERLEAELSRARADLNDKDHKGRDRDGAFDKLHAENRDLASQLAAQTQARLNISEKLDNAQASLKTAESDIASFKTRVSELEMRLSKDQRSLLSAESQYRDQLTERNTLLLTIYQYMDKILGVDKTPKKSAGVKAFAETKTTWRRKYNAKEGEVEALKTTNAELSAQLSSTKRPGQTDSMEIRSLSARAATAERRLNNAQNQLLATEEKVASMSQKTAAADSKWEARVKEYEARLKSAEERVKRERQGSKERVNELENQLKSLQRQLELAQKRSQQLTGVIDSNKTGENAFTRLMDSQRTDEVSSLFNSFPSSGRTPRFKPGAQEEPLDDHASFSSESDNEAVTVYHAPTTDNSSWNFGLEEEDLEEMRRLRSESAAQRQKAAAAEKQARNTKTDSLVKSRGKPGKAKAVVESEDEEDEEMSVSEEEEADADADGDEEEDVDVEGELSEDEIKSVPVAEVDSDGEDDDVPRSPLKPRLKIKLKLPIVPASSTSNTATPVPEEQKVTPSRRAVAKRSAAVRGRRRIQDMESSSSEIESEDGESELVEDEEDEEDDDMQVSVDNSSVTAHTLQGRSKSRSMTTRQAVLASVMDSSHIALDSDLAAQSVQGNTSKKKKVLNETELALRREENARKRKNLSEKRLEDEKLETINRLLKKQSRPRTKRAGEVVVEDVPVQSSMKRVERQRLTRKVMLWRLMGRKGRVRRALRAEMKSKERLQ